MPLLNLAFTTTLSDGSGCSSITGRHAYTIAGDSTLSISPRHLRRYDSVIHPRTSDRNLFSYLSKRKFRIRYITSSECIL